MTRTRMPGATVNARLRGARELLDVLHGDHEDHADGGNADQCRRVGAGLRGHVGDGRGERIGGHGLGVGRRSDREAEHHGADLCGGELELVRAVADRFEHV